MNIIGSKKLIHGSGFYLKIITLLTICGVLLAISVPALAQNKKNSPPSINAVIANAVSVGDVELLEILIFGTNFLNPMVTLGGDNALSYDGASTEEELIVRFPSVDPGDYKLILLQNKHKVEWDLTIGAMGLKDARLYGDGSAGDLLVGIDSLLTATNTSYRNITITAGTLTIPSGTLLRCTGSFTLGDGAVISIQHSPAISNFVFSPNSLILVRPGAAGIGLPPGPPDSRTSDTPALIATPGGPGLSEARARGLREIGPYGGAGGPSIVVANTHFTGGAGGGAAAIRCAGPVTIEGIVQANGAGGAGGGVFLAGSGQSVTVQPTGLIEALGGKGGDAGTFGRRGAGGGGGGGLVHLIAPVVTQSGTINVSGGAGGAGGVAGTVSATVAIGGVGGAGSCGDGGSGGSVGANGSATTGAAGSAGCSLVTEMNPAGFW